jgi:hypothetical protein
MIRHRKVNRKVHITLIFLMRFQRQNYTQEAMNANLQAHFTLLEGEHEKLLVMSS